MCDQRLAGGPLVCVIQDAHRTHVFHATDQPDLKHADAGSDDQ